MWSSNPDKTRFFRYWFWLVFVQFNDTLQVACYFLVEGESVKMAKPTGDDDVDGKLQEWLKLDHVSVQELINN